MRRMIGAMIAAILVSGCGSNPKNYWKPLPVDPVAEQKVAWARSTPWGKRVAGSMLDHLTPEQLWEKYSIENIDPELKRWIRFRPSPGIARTDTGIEVISVEPNSGAYLAFVQAMPVTRFIKILRRADCDDYLRPTAVTEQVYLANEAKFQSGKWRGGQFANLCLNLWQDRFLEKDPRVANADGLIIDLATRVTLNPEGVTVPTSKIHYDGFAFQFVEPTDEDLKSILRERAYRNLDLLRLRQAVYWIVEHQALAYAPLMREYLSKAQNLGELSADYRVVLAGLAALNDPATPTDLWISVLEGGIRGSNYATASSPLATRSEWGIAPRIAAQVLACKGEMHLVPRLVEIAKRAAYLQHKQGAAVAAAMLAGPEVIKPATVGLNPFFGAPIIDLAAGKTYAYFQCPYQIGFETAFLVSDQAADPDKESFSSNLR